MKSINRPIKSNSIIAIPGLVTFSSIKKNERKEKKNNPNVIIILADDLGYRDHGVSKPDSGIPTPNINLLTNCGIRFTTIQKWSKNDLTAGKI